MTYQYVKCPNFVRKDPDTGELLEIMCKLCGTVIAAKAERILRYETNRQGERVKIVSRQFSTNSNYTEIKIAFDDDDPAGHITHGCSKCMTKLLSAPILSELYQADQMESPDGYTDRERARKPLKVEVLRNDAGGIT